MKKRAKETFLKECVELWLQEKVDFCLKKFSKIIKIWLKDDDVTWMLGTAAPGLATVRLFCA
jgi:hypothetical protein